MKIISKCYLAFSIYFSVQTTLYSPIDDLEQVLDVFLAVSSSILAFNVILVVDNIAGEVYQNTYMEDVKERLCGSIN